MRLRIIASGKVKEPHLRAVVDDYLGRVRRYVRVEELETPQGRDNRALRAIERAIPSRFEVWALDAGGTEVTSHDLAARLEGAMDSGVKGIALIIGGADGLPPKIVEGATCTISLSRLTLPHRLARVVLVEQLYRAMTIVRGEPYSK